MNLSKNRRLALTSLLLCALLTPHHTHAAQTWLQWLTSGQWFSKKNAPLLIVGTVGILGAYFGIKKFWNSDPLKTAERKKYLQDLQRKGGSTGGAVLKGYRDKYSHLGLSEDQLCYSFLEFYYPDRLKELVTNKVKIATKEVGTNETYRKNIITFFKEESLSSQDTARILRSFINLDARMLPKYKEQAHELIGNTIKAIFSEQASSPTIKPSAPAKHISRDWVVKTDNLTLHIGWALERSLSHTLAIKTTIHIQRKNTPYFFAVFDGHGGSGYAYLASQLLADAGKGLAAAFLKKKISPKDQDAVTALFADYDKTQFLNNHPLNRNDFNIGSTAVIFMLDGNEGFFINLGDCQGYLIPDSSVTVQTTPHKSTYTDTISGSSATRAFGDVAYKKTDTSVSGVTPERSVSVIPDILALGVMKPGNVIILCSKGVVEATGMKAAYLTSLKKEEKTATAAAERIARDAVRQSKNLDDMAVVVIRFSAP